MSGVHQGFVRGVGRAVQVRLEGQPQSHGPKDRLSLQLLLVREVRSGHGHLPAHFKGAAQRAGAYRLCADTLPLREL